jgi:hypothetical protein
MCLTGLVIGFIVGFIAGLVWRYLQLLSYLGGK